MAGTMLVGATLMGCGAVAERYYEPHHVRDLTIVFLDQKSLHQRYVQLSGKAAMKIHVSASQTHVETVKGFFDFATNTLYCSRMDFESCGHELHHAVLGHFHPDASP
jgi:hypothetical protein